MRISALLCTLMFLVGFLSGVSQPITQDSSYDKGEISSEKNTLSSEASLKSGEVDEEFTIFLCIILLVVIFGASGLGAALLTIGLFIIAGLITAGVLSGSIIVGLYKKSFEKGFIVFIIGLPSAAGSLIGITIFFILNKIMHWWSDITAVLSGGIVGCLSGALFGFLAYIILQRLTTLLVKYLNVSPN